MILIQEGYRCEFEMNIFINIFFDKTDEGSIYTYFSHESDILSVKTKIEFNGEEYFGEYSQKFSSSESDEKLKKRIYCCACTKSFCIAAKKIRNITLPWGVMSGIRPAKSVRKYREKGFSDNEIRGLLKSIYDVSDEKIELAMEVSKNEETVLSKIGENSVSVYIGIPFCPSRCLYCSFVSTDIRYSGKYMDGFVECLIKEIEKTKEILNNLGLHVENIYIGGGTPTTLSAEQLSSILFAVEENLITQKLNEFTLEAGRADTITKEKLKAIKSGNVTRISINPQTANDETLKLIGRKHTFSDVIEKYYEAREVGFDYINMDLIAGLPGETPEMFYRSIDEVIALDPENITVHSMCIKRAAALNFSGIKLSDENYIQKMLSYAQKRMRETGRAPYYMYRQKNISGNSENVGYAKKGRMSFYNINIMEEAQTIIALGGGGASKLVLENDIERVFNFKDPYEYIRRFDEILDKKDEIERILKR